MAPTKDEPIYFGGHLVTSQVFYRTEHSFAIVNLKPLVPGHVLVCPKRIVQRLKDLSATEVTDLFLTVQNVGKMIEVKYNADALNIAMQDGKAAGQSIPHVHTHILPRRVDDMGEDEIYEKLEFKDGDLDRNYLEAEGLPLDPYLERPKFPMPKGERLPRKEQEMVEEATQLAEMMGSGIENVKKVETSGSY